MRAAPAIAVRLDRHAAARAPLAVLAAVSAAAGVLALLQTGFPQAGPSLLALSCVAGLVAAALVLARCRTGCPLELRSGGGRWYVADGAAGSAGPADMDVMLDLDHWMLLRLRPGGSRRGPRWLAVSSRQLPGEWRAFRAALFGTRAHPAPDAAGRLPGAWRP